ncbi:MAG: hypothetical protein M1376_03845 [Planctomycetes bacterium]|nr:hypothetical protein [Planctomycetota bacterium]
MPYYPRGDALRRDAALPGANPFRFDLTEEQKRLCDWVAEQARTGIRHIRYEEAMAALDLHNEQLTRMLRDMRERLDEIHEMVEAPIVNTQAPYFEVPVQARHIWESYRRAEQEVESQTPVDSCELELVEV